MCIDDSSMTMLGFVDCLLSFLLACCCILYISMWTLVCAPFFSGAFNLSLRLPINKREIERERG